MNEHSTFLTALLVAPGDSELRQRYLAWLEAEGDNHAEFLRVDSGYERIAFLDWEIKENNCFTEPSSFDEDLAAYLLRHPELHERIRQHQALRSERAELAELSTKLDPGWVAFMNSLGQPSRPFLFFDNNSPAVFQLRLNPLERQEILNSGSCLDELPFSVGTVTRGSMVTFENSFFSPNSWDEELLSDLQLLAKLPLGECQYGAASCPVHPFLCELDPVETVTARSVLTSLKVRNFLSEHIQSLDVTSLPYPGDHSGTENDEIHNDYLQQHIFAHPEPPDAPEPRGILITCDMPDGLPGLQDQHTAEDMRRWFFTVGKNFRSIKQEDIAASQPAIPDLREMPAGYGKGMDATFVLLSQYVRDRQLWYVLLHSPPELENGVHVCGNVVLLAVGISPNGRRLLGVITHQVCHNLCD